MSSVLPQLVLSGERAGHDFPPSRRYPPGVEIIQQGGPVEDPSLIEAGMVKLSYLSLTGVESIVDFRFSGSLLGIASAILGKPSPVSAITLSSCHIRRIPCTIIHQSLVTETGFSKYVLETLAREVVDLTEKLTGLQTLPAIERLKRLLTAMISHEPLIRSQDGRRLTAVWRRRDMAQFLAVTPEYLSHLLAELETSGAIRRKKGWITVTGSIEGPAF